MTTKEKIEVMQAFEDGKKIQCLSKFADHWIDCYSPLWNWYICDYRIKPEESTYRPYKDTEEMVEDFVKRTGKTYSKMDMPLIYVKYKKANCKYLINTFYDDLVEFDGSVYTLVNLYSDYTYLDGSPLGKLVE